MRHYEHRIKLECLGTVAFDHLSEHVGWDLVEALDDDIIFYDVLFVLF